MIMAPSFHLQMVQGHHLRVQACSLLYKKIMRMNSLGVSQLSIGKLVNIMSNDASRYEVFITIVAQAVIAPLAIGLGIWQIYNRVGNAAFAALGTLMAIAVFGTLVGRYAGLVRVKTARQADKAGFRIDTFISLSATTPSDWMKGHLNEHHFEIHY